MSTKFKIRKITHHIPAIAMLLLGYASGYCSDLPGFKVAGRFLYDHCGEKVILRGVNKMTVWTDIEGEAFPEIAKTGANCVRIVWDLKGTVEKLDAAITKCYENKMIPMVEQHDATGQFDLLSMMVDWWVSDSVVAVIQKHQQYLLVNIANECGAANIETAVFLADYTTAVTRMREAGIRTPLVIDGTDWGKDIDVLQATGPDLIAADPDHNLLFSVHTWWISEWGFSDDMIPNEINESIQMNLPLIVGEFAHTAVGCLGSINYKLLLSECQKNEIGWLSWSWGPGNSDCPDQDMTTGNTYETLSGWGLEVAVTDENSIQNTSVRPKSIVDGVCEGGEVTRFTVSVVATGRGSVTISPDISLVDSGEVLTITATADAENEFLNWSGDATGTDNPLTVTVDQAKTITAVFSDNGPAVGDELVANGDFSDGDNGWTFGAWEGAEGAAVVDNGEYIINMTTAGEEGWYAQLNTTGLDITMGTTYVVSFSARAESAYDLQVVVGMQEDPWTAYSGYKRFSVGTEMKPFSFEFTMSDTSDQNARIVFDLGDYSGTLVLDDVSVRPQEGSGLQTLRSPGRNGSPYSIQYKGNGTFLFNSPEAVLGSFELYDISGKCLDKSARAAYTAGCTALPFRTGQLPAGTYIIRLRSSTASFSKHLVTTER